MAVTAFLPKWYLATTKVRVEKPESDVKLFQAQGNTAYDPYFLQDQFKIMQNEKIIYPVIDKLGLNSRLAASAGAPGATLTSDITYQYIISKMLRVESQRSSSLIDINVYAQDPALAAEIANEIAHVYSDDRISQATSQQSEGVAQLRKEMALQEEVVTKQRDAVEKLRKDLNISGVDLNVKYSDMEIETLRQMQNSLIALRVDAIGRKTRWERFRSIPIEDRMGLVNSELIPDQNIQNLLQAYLIADQKVTQLKARLGEAHPDLVAAIENRAKIKEQLEALLRGLRERLGERLQGGGGARRRAREPAGEGQGGPDPLGPRPDAPVRGGGAASRRRDATLHDAPADPPPARDRFPGPEADDRDPEHG